MHGCPLACFSIQPHRFFPSRRDLSASADLQVLRLLNLFDYEFEWNDSARYRTQTQQGLLPNSSVSIRNSAAFLDTQSTNVSDVCLSLNSRTNRYSFDSQVHPVARYDRKWNTNFIFYSLSHPPRRERVSGLILFLHRLTARWTCSFRSFRHKTTCITTVICDNAAFLWLTFCTSRRASKRDNARRVDSATCETNYADHSYPCPRCVKYLARRTLAIAPDSFFSFFSFCREFFHPAREPFADLGLRL